LHRSNDEQCTAGEFIGTCLRKTAGSLEMMQNDEFYSFDQMLAPAPSRLGAGLNFAQNCIS
jgi:hypothetical protein